MTPEPVTLQPEALDPAARLHLLLLDPGRIDEGIEHLVELRGLSRDEVAARVVAAFPPGDATGGDLARFADGAPRGPGRQPQAVRVVRFHARRAQSSPLNVPADGELFEGGLSELGRFLGVSYAQLAVGLSRARQLGQRTAIVRGVEFCREGDLSPEEVERLVRAGRAEEERADRDEDASREVAERAAKGSAAPEAAAPPPSPFREPGDVRQPVVLRRVVPGQDGHGLKKDQPTYGAQHTGRWGDPANLGGADELDAPGPAERPPMVVDYDEVSRRAEAMALEVAESRLKFPRDHAAHPEDRNEWWHFVGQNDRYAIQLTVFRQDVLWVAQLGVKWSGTDVFERHERAGLAPGWRPDDPRLRGDGFEVHLGATDRPWQLQLRREGGQWVFFASLDVPGAHMTVRFTQDEAEPRLLGDAGRSERGEGRATSYVAIERMKLNVIASTQTGRPDPASGEDYKLLYNESGWGWHEHEWGTGFLPPGVEGWDFVASRMAGRDSLSLIRVYGLRDEGGLYTPESFVTVRVYRGAEAAQPADHVYRLRNPDSPRPPDYLYEGMKDDEACFWSEQLGEGGYPQAFRLVVPHEAIDCRINVRPNCEHPGGLLPAYVEAPIASVEAIDAGCWGKQFFGFVEMTGYRAPLRFPAHGEPLAAAPEVAPQLTPAGLAGLRETPRFKLSLRRSS